MSDRCEYCNNRAHRQRGHPVISRVVPLCEVHYVRLEELDDPRPFAEFTLDEIEEMDECYRCGTKGLNRRGDSQRLIEHHVNYPLDLTVLLCDSCHQKVHNDPDSPFHPRGIKMQEGIAVSDRERMKRKRERSFKEAGDTE